VTVDGKPTLRYVQQNVTIDSTNAVPNCVWNATAGSRLALVGNGKSANVFTIRDFRADGLAFDLNHPDAPKKVFIDAPADPLHVGYVLPGNGVSKIANTNEAVRLVADYVAPAGVTMDVSSLPSDWHEGFSTVAVSNLTVDAGAGLSFDFFVPGFAPLAIGGVLSLPGEMDYFVNAGSSRSDVKDAAVVVPALGVETAAETDWNCIGRVKQDRAELSVVDGALVFSCDVPGMMIIMR
jgi:hypothetical protein